MDSTKVKKDNILIHLKDIINIKMFTESKISVSFMELEVFTT